MTAPKSRASTSANRSASTSANRSAGTAVRASDSARSVSLAIAAKPLAGLLPLALGESPDADALSLTLAEAEASTIDITFEDLGLSEAMLASLRSAGYTRPTPIQAQAVPLALVGRDLMGLALTGRGKTAAVTIPIIS